VIDDDLVQDLRLVVILCHARSSTLKFLVLNRQEASLPDGIARSGLFEATAGGQDEL
jgi:hypothetical protein